MRLLTKVMAGVSVLALSVLVAGGVNAQAATFTTDKHMGGITSGDMVSYDAVKEKGGKLTWNAKAKWDTYYGTVSYVDISNIKTAKDAYITVKSAAGYNVYKIEKDTVKKYAGKVVGTTLELTVDTTKLDKTSTSTTDTTKSWASYQYRTESGAWENLTASQDLALAPYEQQGATLYFRYKGATTVTTAADSSATIEGKPEGATITVNKIPANSFASKEFKVKVPKLGNAPSISIDYTTGTVKANVKAEYRQGTTFADATSGWAAFKDNFTINTAAAGIFQMRTAATDKKAASKIAVYSWPIVAAPTVNGNTAVADKGTLITGELEYVSAQVTDKKKAVFEIENKTEDKTIALYKAKMSGTTVDMSSGKAVAEGKAVATLAPGKKVLLKDAKVADGTVLLVQYAGDKKADKLPSPFAASQVKVLYNVKAE